MDYEERIRGELADGLWEKFFKSPVWQGSESLDIRSIVLRLVGLVALYALSRLSFEWSMDLVRRSELSRYVGLALFGLSLVCWMGGSLALGTTIWHLGLGRLLLFLGVGLVLLAIATTLLSDSEQSPDQDIMSMAETMFSRLVRQSREILADQALAPVEFQRAFAAPARPTPTPARDVAVALVLTPEVTRKSIQLPASAKPTCTPRRGLAPLEATPRAAAAGLAPLAIDFLVDGIEFDQDSVKLNVTIKRRADTSLSWTSDESRRDEIYLTAGSQRYELLDMGGIFVQNTALQPAESYQGWFSFEKPGDDAFTFCYPDIEPLPIESNF
jgi:hypothetical protein